MLKVSQSLVTTAIVCHFSAQADPEFKDIFEEDFAAAIILTDSDALTLGFKDFDPNSVFNIDNDNIGSQDALDRRKNIGVSHCLLPLISLTTRCFNDELSFVSPHLGLKIR